MSDLTPQQAARELGCSRTLIYRLIERGELPGTYELPGSIRKRILRTDITALKTRHRVNACSQLPPYEPQLAPVGARPSAGFATELDAIERSEAV